ncbi:MAG: spore coat protein U domain-containing protein [Mariprofundus sp.]|nr:spore coat protein U domain-containing protein [Mariprofundus sp.]
MMINRLAIYACMLSAICTFTAQAASNNTNLSVSVSVPPQVIVNSGQINFGVSTNPTTTLTASGTFQVTVSAGYAYHITLDAGLHAVTMRRMAASTGFFRPYELYQDAAFARTWGDAAFAGSYSSGSPLAATGTGIAQTFTVYAASQGQASAAEPLGNYTDIVTITIHY